jgi:hypothetical protein
VSVRSCSHCHLYRNCVQLSLSKRRSPLTRRLAFTLFLVLACVGPALTQSSSPSQPDTFHRITLGHSVVALNGPWKFHIGDSPLDPVTRTPLWASPSFDDSTWETVDLTPETVSFDPIGGNPGYVPGWTTRGHPGISGYGWYRSRVRIETQPGEGLAVAGAAKRTPPASSSASTSTALLHLPMQATCHPTSMASRFPSKVLYHSA